MKRLFVLVAALALIAGSRRANAQEGQECVVSIYNVATGKHLDFLRWMAENEEVAKEAGAPAAQWYVHHNGAGWDFISITPQLSPKDQEAMDKKVDELSKKRGLPIGFPASLKFRQFISSHSDTYAGGPFTAAQLVKMAEAK